MFYGALTDRLGSQVEVERSAKELTMGCVLRLTQEYILC